MLDCPEEHDPLEGYRWAQLGKWAGWRTVPTLLVVLCLTAPYGSTLSLLLAGSESSCGSQCCKRSKACCCRKSGRNVHQDGPAWAPSSKCPNGCGQLPAAQNKLAASHRRARIDVAPVVFVSQTLRPTNPAASASDVPFPLFERPPPVSI